MLLNSVKSLFKNLKNFDLLKFDDSEEDVRELAAKKLCDIFCEGQKKLRDNVFAAIERCLKKIVKEGDKTKRYTNGDGKEESLEDRIEFVKNYLLSQEEKKTTP